MAQPMRRPIPRGQKGAKLSRTGIDPRSGKKVFAREFKSGFQMAKAAGLQSGGPKGAPGAKQLRAMSQRLRGIDAGRIQPKLGERSFLRGVLAGAGGGGGG